MSIFNINPENPFYSQIITTAQSLHMIKNNIMREKQNKKDIAYLLISIFGGVIVSILASFQKSRLYSIPFAIIFFVLIGIFYFIQTKKSKKELGKLFSEQEDCIIRLYDFKQISKEELESYSKKGLISSKKIIKLLEDAKEKCGKQAVEIMNLKNEKLERFFKTKIIYKNNKEEIYNKAFVDQTNKQILVFGESGVLSKIIFVDFAEVKSVEIIN
jgi:hypothetical protein